MIRTFLKFLLLALILILIQVTVFNNICLFGVAVPMVFIYVILRLPLTLSTGWVLTVAFLMGLTVDVFSDTQGMNSLACTILGAVRRPVLGLYFPREDELANPEPTMVSLGVPVYVKYALSMTLIYCTLIFLIEAFSFFNILRLVLRIIFSTILSTLLILAVDGLTTKRYAKRL
ncbi:MAG: rod shape-determining protein MreD [Candidatus Amulumruptor caecigallinarius]|nr:rod shape-determining protein MreD [Candidatus Amulumruptor caecigallinarius]MCM1397044.1 rod shape-determining protein MreD [Candidatus Amulumruptor caecigallinarius]MCM1454020.1 rod shape-determining protein MreD [bacterium]